MFDPPATLLLGLVTGLVFGWLLQKGQVAKYRVILGQLLFRDWTVARVMGTAVIVGAVGVHALVALGEAELAVKPMRVAGVLLGSLVFGSGMALLGYCPGTSLAAAAEGRRDAWTGILGMLCGALTFVAARPALDRLAVSLGDHGELTLPGLTGTSPWWWVGGLVVAGAVALVAARARA
ncbi:MAG: YeeE/YedE family protein [Myxococcales bacterium]|nr:YeeE/YedE family protein [Myxococcales bacterium]